MSSSRQNKQKVGNNQQKQNQNQKRQPKPNRVRKVAPGSMIRRNPNLGDSVSVKNRSPIIQSRGNKGGIRVIMREWMGEIVGSVAFTLGAVQPINPGLPSQFPWLWAIANNYESYSIKKLHYDFVNAKTGTFAGRIIMAIDYDPADAIPLSEANFRNYSGAQDSCITEAMQLAAVPRFLHKTSLTKMTRMGTLDANEDIKTYDCGNFFWATKGCADTSVIGDLYVDYVIDFETPQPPDQWLSCLVAPVGEALATPLGTSLVVTGVLGVTWLSSTTFSINTPGQYLMVGYTVGTVITTPCKASAVSGSSQRSSGTDVIDSGALLANSVQRLVVASPSDVFTVAASATTLTSYSFRLAGYTFANL